MVWELGVHLLGILTNRSTHFDPASPSPLGHTPYSVWPPGAGNFARDQEGAMLTPSHLSPPNGAGNMDSFDRY